ncbi:hypothetical protein PybrP1_002442 [[Pythium] brassicae (nom. inval.)]|nr:hypothetical protein PybrP1_002442 [[Pythium] brassicae (nom. inval.)]
MTSSGPPSTSSATTDDGMLELESLVDAATFDDKVGLEDFTLIRVIGKGSFGKVTLVRKTTNSKIFAMKILSKAHLLKRKQELFARIREAPLEIPKYLGADAASLISLLLHREPEKRLGSRGAAEVKAHRFFRSVDWDGLLWSEPPFKPSDPQSKEAGDTSNFDKEFTELPVTGTPMSRSSTGSALPRSMFTGFTYEAPAMSFGSDTSQSKVDVSSTPYI